jgi:hypothetical protein
MKAIVKKLGTGIAGAASLLIGLASVGVDLVPMDKLWIALPVGIAGGITLYAMVKQ